MTGFGRSVSDGEGTPGVPRARWVVEVRSVNHRGFDLKLRGPDLDPSLEADIGRSVRAVVERGTVTVSIREESAAAGSVDAARIREVLGALEDLRVQAGLATPVDLATVAAFMAAESNAARSTSRSDETAAAIRSGVATALGQLVVTRESEGAALVADLGARLRRMTALAASIEQAAAEIPMRFARRLKERLAALYEAPGFDAGRVAQEIALLAERLDVSEELVRLGAHLEQLNALLGSSGPVGRKLDFVLQEAAREVNTIGSKAQDAAIAGLVIECKAELEKIREQAQNIE